jgi:tRNA A37 methylthiotransferase MiaB
MKIYWLNPPLSMRCFYADLAYLNFTTVCPQYDWVQPIVDWDEYNSVESIVAEILRNEVDVVCFSTYVWSHVLCHKIVSQLKEIKPSIITIMGGPHQGYDENFFKKYDHVDYCCFATGHGELFLKEILPQIEKYGKVVEPDKVPFLISRDYVCKNEKLFYEWPVESGLEKNMDYLLNVVSTAKRKNKTATIPYETTRGCPYSCVYCEWGGGIGSKVSKKSLELIKKDLEIISLLGFDCLEIVDANFGILDRDIDILNCIVENKKVYNNPSDFLIYGLAKAKMEKREKILDVLFENKMCSSYPMSIQAYDEGVLKNVKRSDITFEENFQLSKKYREKYGVQTRVEIILGLPGYSLETFYKEMDLYKESNCWFCLRNVFSLLPDSEASSNSYRKMHNLKTVLIGSMCNEEHDLTYVGDNILSKYRSSSEIVIGADGYTTTEWMQMYFMNRAQRVLGPMLPKDSVPSVEMPKLFSIIEKQEWYVPIKNVIEKIVNNEMEHEDITLIDNKTIEDILSLHAENIMALANGEQ